MGVYIKGMEIPHDCDSCKVSDILDCTLWKPMDIGERHPECPLVEVPTSHGDLIDRDELKKEFPKDTDWEYPVNTNEYVCETIDEAKTVLEAEDE